VFKRLETLECKNHELESNIGVVRMDQKHILGSYQDLESRYRDIIMENRQIKGELADLRKN
jgi:hypothetical protein